MTLIQQATNGIRQWVAGASIATGLAAGAIGCATAGSSEHGSNAAVPINQAGPTMFEIHQAQVEAGKLQPLRDGAVKFDPNQSAPSPKASPAQPAAPQIAADELPTRR